MPQLKTRDRRAKPIETPLDTSGFAIPTLIFYTVEMLVNLPLIMGRVGCSI